MPPQSLRIHSPTPSTTAYTVTTRTLPRTRLARLFERLLFLTQLSLILAVAAAFALVVADHYNAVLWTGLGRAGSGGVEGLVEGLRRGERSWGRSGWWSNRVLQRARGRGEGGAEQEDFWRTLSLVGPLEWVRVVEAMTSEKIGEEFGVWVILGALVICWSVLMRRGYVEESIIAMRSLGVQTSTSSLSIFSAPTTRFISTSQIQDIFIYEAFIGFTVRFYLAVIVEGEEQAVVVFPTLLPRREVVEEVWRGVRRVLWDAGCGGEGVNGHAAKRRDTDDVDNATVRETKT